MKRILASGALLATLAIVPALSSTVAYADSGNGGDHQPPTTSQHSDGYSHSVGHSEGFSTGTSHSDGQSTSSSKKSGNDHKAEAQANKQERTKYRTEFQAELKQVKADRDASHQEHQALVSSFRSFVGAVQSAAKAGDATDLQSAIQQAHGIIDTLHSALSDQTKADSNMQSGNQDASKADTSSSSTQTNPWQTATTHFQTADQLILAKTEAMKQAVSSLDALTATLNQEVTAYAASHPQTQTSDTSNNTTGDANSTDTNSTSSTNSTADTNTVDSTSNTSN